MPNPTSKLNLVINGTTTQLDIHDANAVDLTNNQTVGGNKEFTGTTTAHDLVPSATDTYNFGSPSVQWNNAYIKSLTINGVACGDILTHNVSEFVDVSSNQTIAGNKSFTGFVIFNPYRVQIKQSSQEIGVVPSSNRWNGINFTDKNNSSTFSIEQAFFSNGNTVVHFSMTPNIAGGSLLRIFESTYYASTAEIVIRSRTLIPDANNSRDLGTSTNKWKSFNGVNPGALSLPSNSYVNVDTTNWDLTCQNGLLGSFTPTADGWLMLHVGNSGASEVNFWIIGGVLRINNKSALNTTGNNNSNMITIPVEKDVTYNIYGNASEYVAGRSIAYCRFMPCQGNV